MGWHTSCEMAPRSNRSFVRHPFATRRYAAMKPGRHIALLRLARLPLALAAVFALAAPAHTEDNAGAVYSIVVPYGNEPAAGTADQASRRRRTSTRRRAWLRPRSARRSSPRCAPLGFTPQIDQAETARIQNFIATRSADLDRRQADRPQEGAQHRQRRALVLPHGRAGLPDLRRHRRRASRLRQDRGPRQELDGHAAGDPAGRHRGSRQLALVVREPADQVPAGVDRHPLQPEPVPGRPEPGPRAGDRQLRQAGRQVRAAAEHGLDRRHPCARIRAAGSRHQVPRVAARQLQDRSRTLG